MAKFGTGFLRPKRLLGRLWPGVLAIFGAHAAAAQSAPLSPSATRQLPAYCTTSKSTSTEFLQAIQKIIAHGDLTDVAFIEYTLKTKLTTTSPVMADMSGIKSIEYDSSQVLGSPISAMLIVNINKKRQVTANTIAILKLADLYPYRNEQYLHFMEGCLQLPPDYFFSYFGGHFETLPNPPGAVVYQDLKYGSKGKYGSQLYLDYGYDLNVKLASWVSIVERPASILSR